MQLKNNTISRMLQPIAGRVLRFLTSRNFTILIVTLFVIQAGWFAVSFTYGMVFDEDYHFGIIKAYTTQLGPIIYDQPQQLDYLRDLENESSFLYHYLMSFPLRALMLVTDNMMVQVIALRFMNVVFVAGALLIYMRIFRRIGVPKIARNLALLLFTMLPIFPYLAATVNYDNLLLLLASSYLLVWVAYLQSKSPTWPYVGGILLLGIFASLIKFTFLPVFAISLLILLVHQIRHFRRQKQYGKMLWKSFKQTRLWLNSVLVIGLILSGGLFLATYGKNVIVYGTPQPSCQKTLGAERCKSNPVVKRTNMVMASRNEREPDPLINYANLWVMTMLGSNSVMWVRDDNGMIDKPNSLPIITHTIYIGAILATVGIVARWRLLTDTKEKRFLWIVIGIVVVSVFLKNASGYFTHYIPLAIQPRYLFMAVPLLLAFAVWAFQDMLKRHKSVGLASIVVVMLLLTQGGGMLSFLVQSKDTWFYSTSVKATNRVLRDAVTPLIRQYPGKYGI